MLFLYDHFLTVDDVEARLGDGGDAHARECVDAFFFNLAGGDAVDAGRGIRTVGYGELRFEVIGLKGEVKRRVGYVGSLFGVDLTGVALIICFLKQEVNDPL